MIDRFDRAILSVMQEDASVSVLALSARVGLSASPCWKRLKRLEAEGYLRKRVALLDRDKLSLGVTVFVAVKTNHHDASWLEEFAAAVSTFPEVMEFYRMSGEVDYLLKVACADIADYDRFYKKLTASTKLLDVSSSFAMEQIKFTTALPIG